MPAPPTDDHRDLFDALYPRLLAPFHPEEDARRETAALRDLLGLAQSDRILDLGCGWGRHLRLLREAGHRVVGIDLSLVFLRMAAQAEGDGLPAEPSTTRSRPVLLAASDMRRLPIRDRAFDVVLNLATSLGLFLEDGPAVRALEEAARVLKPGGTLLVEGMHRDDVVAQYAPRDGWTLEDGTRVRVRRWFDPLSGVSQERMQWRGPLGEGVKEHALRLRSATEMTGLLEAAGLRVREAYGDWNGEPFRHDSPRLLLRADRSS